MRQEPPFSRRSPRGRGAPELFFAVCAGIAFLSASPMVRASEAMAPASEAIAPQDPPGPSPTAKARGSLVFGEREHSFGSLLEGDEAVFDFPFEVQGDAPVAVARVHSSCGCTVPILEANGKPYEFGSVLPVGAKGFVRARVKTYEFVGSKSSQITIYSDASENSLVLTISSFVRRFYVTEPEYLNLGEVLEGEKRKSTVKVRTAETAEFAIESWGAARLRREVPLESNGRPKISEKEIRERELEDALGVTERPESLGVKFERTAPNEWAIEVEIDASAMPVGAFLHTLRFTTSDKRAFDVRVQGVILPLVGTHPAPRVAFGLLRKGMAKEITLALVDYDPSVDVKLLEAKLLTPALADHLELGAVPSSPKNDEQGRPTWPITIKAKESLAKGPFEGLVELRTDHPKYPVIQVPVTGFVR